ncbi:hypothetical protein OLQ22_06340 [Campylobacter jejuni]|nr:hypothetical protein [Campylobacter jejuni]
MISLKEEQSQNSQKFQECLGENKEEIKALKAQIELVDKRIRDIQASLANMEMARTLEFLSQRQTLPKTSNLSHYILFEYSDHIRSSFRNLGDYVQTFAVKKALDKIEQNFTYEFFDRDNFSFYNGGGYCNYASLFCKEKIFHT